MQRRIYCNFVRMLSQLITGGNKILCQLPTGAPLDELNALGDESPEISVKKIVWMAHTYSE